MPSEHAYRLVLHGAGDGAWNMAVDEALLESVGEGGCGPVIRFYAFNRNTLSVGRFQSVEEDFDTGRLSTSGITLVRRPSGGRAVLHNDELTYAVVIGRPHLVPFGKRKVYAFIVPLLLDGLSRLGLGSAVNSATRGDLRNPDCFAATGEYEIDSGGGRKLIGSAQMITRTAVLQHGSIPISATARSLTALLTKRPGSDENEADETHLSTSIADEIGRTPDFIEVRNAFEQAVRLKLTCVDSGLTDRERDRAERLVREKYSRSSWNLMRNDPD